SATTSDTRGRSGALESLLSWIARSFAVFPSPARSDSPLTPSGLPWNVASARGGAAAGAGGAPANPTRDATAQARSEIESPTPLRDRRVVMRSLLRRSLLGPIFALGERPPQRVRTPPAGPFASAAWPRRDARTLATGNFQTQPRRDPHRPSAARISRS